MNKTELLLQMMQQPKSYTDDQWQEILADDECHELYTLMAKTQSAVDALRADEEITDETIDAEWQRLRSERRRVKSPFRVAASFMGLLFISGIAFAAVHLVRHNQKPENTQVADTMVVADASLSTRRSSLPKDTATVQPVIYDNTPLERMLPEIAAHYGAIVSFRDDAARQLRLFYQWRPEYSIDRVIGMLNNFESLYLQLKGDTLFVSSSAHPQP